MSDDFGTVNVRGGLDAQRLLYKKHRDALQRMSAHAPTPHLASVYDELVRELDDELRKLGDAEPRTVAGDRPLERSRESVDEPLPDARGGTNMRVAAIVIAGVLVVAAIIYLMWHGAEKKPVTTPVAETSVPADTAVPSTTEPATQPTQTSITPVATAVSIKVAPAINDYGVIRKGTRAVRQFDVTNSGSDPVTIQVSRSECHCLFYDYNAKVAPKKKETITVAIDGARAKAGPLHETVTVTTKEDPSATAQFAVQATIK